EISNNEASNYGGGVYIFRYGGTFTMEGGTISNNTATSGGGVYLDSGKTFNLTGGTVDGNTATTSGGGVYVYSKGTFNMTGGEVSNNTAASSGGGVYNEGTLSITNSTVTKNTAETYGGGIYAGNGFTISGLVDITENTVNGEANNAYLSSGKVITVDGTPDDATMVGVTTANPPTEDSYVNVTGENSGDYTEYFSSDGNYFVLNSSANQVQLAVITSGIYVQYEKISGNTWNINLVGGGTSSIIYRFLAAQLKFAIDNPDIAYTIKPVSGINLTENNGVYEFNLSNSTASGTEKAITAHSITIGTVTFAGVGDFEFGVDETYEDNEAQTAVYNSVDNNLIRTYYVPDVSGTIDSELYIDDVITDTLSLDTASLTINVMFPNAVTAQGDAYNDMKVTINGVNKTDEEIYFGTGTQGSLNADGVVIYGADADNYTGAAGYTTTVNDVYQGYAYTLVFEGAGYRTFRTTVVPASDSATVTVWNNAMDNNMVVVSTTDDAMGGDTEKVTFLAGDIVADENINLYDLSAVVSYFGKTNDTDYTSEFAKYDLDRDGKIDSKDIAMVLVSWNK
ncbi:MAG: dockerin type I domain-containing protein, partial [Oscillospiraceae bacterium]|nr:dockerin type I domain-containing protein [Oscillospiraceae bacterium]